MEFKHIRNNKLNTKDDDDDDDDVGVSSKRVC